MKTRILSLFLALVLTLSLCVPAFATDEASAEPEEIVEEIENAPLEAEKPAETEDAAEDEEPAEVIELTEIEMSPDELAIPAAAAGNSSYTLRLKGNMQGIMEYWNDVQDGSVLPVDKILQVYLNQGYKLTVISGGRLEHSSYHVTSSGILYRVYDILPTGDDEMVIEIVSDSTPAPSVVPLTVLCDVGEYDDIVHYAPEYAVAGGQSFVDVDSRYTLEAVAGCRVSGSEIYVFEDATEVVVKVVVATPLKLVFNDPTGQAHIYDEDGAELKSGDSVYRGSTLTGTLPDGFVFLGSDVGFGSRDNGKMSIHIYMDAEGDTITISVVKGITVRLQGATDKIMEDWGSAQDGTLLSPNQPAYLYLEPGYTASVISGGDLRYSEYDVDRFGQICRACDVWPTGDDEMVIEIVSDPEPVPSAVPVTILCDVGEYEDIVYYAPRYALTGRSVYVEMNSKYKLEAVAGCRVNGSSAYVFEDAMEVVVKVVEATPLKLIFNDPTGQAHIYDEDGNELRSGDSVYPGSRLTGTAPDGYTFGGDISVWQENGKIRIYVENWNDSDTVTISVIKRIRIYFTGAVDALKDNVNGEELDYYDGGYRIHIRLEPTYEAVVLENGRVNYDYYQLNSETGKVLYRNFGIIGDGNGDVTVSIRKSSDPEPTPIKVNYVDAYDAILTKNNKYVLAGSEMDVLVKDGYTITVKGGECYPTRWPTENGTYQEGYYVWPYDNTTELTITSVKLNDKAKLMVTGDAGALVTGVLNGDETVYLKSGSTITGGSGYILLKNGYYIATDEVAGGKVSYKGYVYDSIGGEVYAKYAVMAIDDAVNVTVIESMPVRWIELQIVNNDDVRYAVFDYEQRGSDGMSYTVLSNGYIYLMMYDSAYTIMVSGGEVVRYFEDYNEYMIGVNDGAQKVTVTITKSDAKRGDINGDGEVTLKDVTKLFQFVNKQIATLGGANGDINGDGEVTLKDVTKLFQFVNKQIPTI